MAEKLGIKPTGFRCEREDGRFEIVDSLERAGFLRGKWEEQDPENENVWISDEYPWFSEPGVRNFDLVIEALADRAASINYDPDGLGAGVVTITDSAGRQSVAQGPVKMRRIAVLEAVAAMEE